jgi:POT family proton-dependent oligopeptide transporter
MIGHFTLALPGVFTGLPHVEVFYLGLMFIVAGTGLLKPNISAIVGQLYPDGGARRDAGFSVFYMGINLGATLGPLVCSFLGEKVNWHYGFGAAGVGMLLGLVQYRLTERHLGNAGKHPASTGDAGRDAQIRRRGWRMVWGAVALMVAVFAVLLTGGLPIAPTALAKMLGVFIVGVATAFFLWVVLFGRLTAAERRHVGVIAIFFIGAALFWSGFEQAGSTLNIFAKRYTDRTFLGAWFEPSPEFEPGDVRNPDALAQRLSAGSDPVSAYVWTRMTEEGRSSLRPADSLGASAAERESVLASELSGILGGAVIFETNRFAGIPLSPETQALLSSTTMGDRRARLNRWLLEDAYPEAIRRHTEKRGEHPAGYYQSINPLFIILLAPFFAGFWITLARRNMEPSAPMKFALGFVQLGLGFGVIAVASVLVLRGGEAGKVLPTWLLFTYLLHTTGELCLSPIGLSWVTKLAPERYVGQMMGTWFMGAALGNLVGGLVAGLFGEESLEQMPERFGMIVITTLGTGLLFAVFARPIRRLIGEVK